MSDCCDYGEYRYAGPYPISAEMDPDDITDFAFQWGAWLQGDTITVSEFLLPDGLTEESSSVSGSITQIFVSGGTACSIYRITNRVTTAGGRRKDKTVAIRVRES